MNVVNHLKVAVLRFAVPIIVSIASLCSQLSRAQETPSFQLPAAVNPVQWMIGPSEAKLGDVARINVPDGFQFVDAKGARVVLEGLHNPVPPNLVGILAPSSAKWYAVIKYANVGYVKDTDSAKLDPALMLGKIQTILSRQSVPISSLDWEIRPSYDSSQNKLEYAIRVVTTGNPTTVNYTVQLFGRRGIMEAVAVQPQADFDAAPLREMSKNISFQSGERYADYQAGDKLAATTLAQMANNIGAPAAGIHGGHTVLWIGIGVVGVVLLAGAGLMVAARSRRSHSVPTARQAASSSSRQPIPAAQPAGGTQVSPAPAGATARLSAISTREGGVPQRREPDRNRRPSLSKSAARKRRKQYNFHLFYSDMIMNLTRWNYMGGFGSFESDYSHGLTNGNGNGNGSAPDQNGTVETGLPAAGAPGDNHITNGNAPNGLNGNHTGISVVPNKLPPDAASLLAIETAKLIENQQKLIEGQRKLIDEQNKLIQEKSKLIDFESSVLGKQSELIGEQELL